MSANELARKVVTNELKVQNEDLGHWMCRLEKKDAGKKQVQEIVETKEGSLSRLLSTDGRPLDAKQQQKESRRIQTLGSNPGEQRKLQQASIKKAEQGKQLFKILPDVFVFGYAGCQGDLIKLSYRPNPNFRPPSIEARVFHRVESVFRPQGACSHEPHIRAYAATARERPLYRDGLEQLRLLSQPARLEQPGHTHGGWQRSFGRGVSDEDLASVVVYLRSLPAAALRRSARTHRGPEPYARSGNRSGQLDR